jgi:uncharacterized membrane protein
VIQNLGNIGFRSARVFEAEAIDENLFKLNSELLLLVITKSVEAKDTEGLLKTLNKLSFVGRKITMSVRNCLGRLPFILRLYISLIDLVSQDVLQEISPSVLNLVYRTYTNKELSESEVRTLSVEIVEKLQKKLSSEFFLSVYTQVKEQS